MANQVTYVFGLGKCAGSASMKNLLGGKGANLCEMSSLGLPVPPGTIITTEQCTAYRKASAEKKAELVSELVLAVSKDFEPIKKKFGYTPLMSVRSGARVSMPGMMDTILNVGITSANLADWQKRIGDVAALDCRRRLIEMLAGVVYELPVEILHDGLSLPKAITKKAELELTVAHYLSQFESVMEFSFPDSVYDQLTVCVAAVFNSWDNERAVEYRNLHGYSHDWGTAVTVQSMVFGNFNEKSCSGVMFSRNPSTGEPGVYGEFLPNAQGEDVVAGTHTPMSMSDMPKWSAKVAKQLGDLAANLEAHFRDMQDIEFTVQDGELFVLQTRTGKRSAQAAFRIAYDLAKDKLITQEEAIKRVSGKQFYTLKSPMIDPAFKGPANFTGIPAAGSLVRGVAVLSADAAKKCKEPCILVAKETTPDDFGGMVASVGILTSTGGATSHAAVVARGMDKTCVVGCLALKPGVNVKEGDKITLDGKTGRVWVNQEVPITAGNVTKEAEAILAWAKKDTTTATLRVSVEPHAITLPASGQLVIDVRKLCVKNPKSQKRYFRELLNQLSANKNLSGVIDFTGPSAEAHADDDTFDAMLGLLGTTAKKEAGVHLDQYALDHSFCLGKWAASFVARWTIKIEAGAVRDSMQEYGWPMVAEASTLKELLGFPGGMLTLTPALMAQLKAEALEFDSIMALLASAGRVAKPVLNGVREESMVFEVLGKA